MNTFIAFYKNRHVEVRAESSLAAQRLAAKLFGARKHYEVAVVLAEREDGSTVVHSPGELP